MKYKRDLARTGLLWGFEHFGIQPDILLLGIALGGGMPLGAFIASRHHMKQLAADPVLGHITTFGGHPVSCAAGLAALEVLLEEQILHKLSEKQELFLSLLQHPAIRSIRHFGLWFALEFDSFETNQGRYRLLHHPWYTDRLVFVRPGLFAFVSATDH